MNKIKYLALAMILALVGTSCEDMLTVDTGDKLYENGNDTLYSYLGIMKCMQDVAERQIILNELRGDLVSTTEYITDTLHAISNFDDPQDGSCSMLNISSYYSIINNCNFYLHYADTSRVKRNIKFMKPEYAQVAAVRAWAYLQLVQNYGSVPFITEPVKDLGIIKRFDYKNRQADKDNLIDLILETGIEDFIDTEYPTYETFNNGSSDISARMLCIPIRLVLADMYLLRGQDEADYRQAAQYYYDFLKKINGIVRAGNCTATENRNANEEDDTEEKYTLSAGSWGGYANTLSGNAESNEVICFIPSSANKQFGTMLTRVADIYGYTPTSRQNTNITENVAANTESATTSGAITVDATYKAQVAPSGAYFTLNNAQTYIYYDMALSTPRLEAYESGDARYGGSTEKILEDGEAYYLCAKAAKGRQFYYAIPLYRRTQIWLRLAEAINRAGFPEFAFAILKDGLCADNMPEKATRFIYTPVVDENGDTVYVQATNPITGAPITRPELDEEGNVIDVPVMTILNDTTEEEYLRLNQYGAMNYVDSLELRDFFLDFTNEIWDDNYGLHARGCGYGSWTGTIKSTNITGYHDSIYYDYNKLLVEKYGVDPAGNKADIIDAVENIICDEMGLELAFEGSRFTDLVRMAEHKMASGKDGAGWLADKIANRNIKYNRFTEKTVGERNEELYNKLLNKENWYFTKPAWDVKK